MSALSRRTLLQGAAVGAVAASVVTLPESASATPAVDSVLLLKAEYDRLGTEQALAEAEEERIIATLPRDVLRGPEVQLPPYQVAGETFTPKPIRFASEEDIHKLANSNRNAPTEAPRMVKLWRADRDRIDAARAAAGLTAAEERADRLAEQIYAVEQEIYRTKAATFAGLVAQIDLLRACWIQDEPRQMLAETVICRLREMEAGR